MPELPEVETIARDLSPRLVNLKISQVRVLVGRLVNLPVRQWEKRLIGKKIKKVWRRGKHIIFDLSDGEHLVIHLKMTGQLIWRGRRALVVGGHPIVGVGQKLPNRFSRVVFAFSDGSRLFFNDVRKFGWLKILSTDDLQTLLAKLGPEPLAGGLTAARLHELLAGKARSRLKTALLDQSKMAGLGNIYVDEVLFASHLRPDRPVASVKPTEWLALAAAIKRVLRLAIKHRGTSFSDYRDAQGEKGNFLKYLQVYGRSGQNCRHCGRPLNKTKLNGRGTHWCERCQK